MISFLTLTRARSKMTLKDKKYYCKDCPKEINFHTALYGGGRCGSCSTKHHWNTGKLKKGKNHPSYIDGRCSKKYFCKCGNEIHMATALRKSGLCEHCAKIGKNNPNYKNGLGITPLVHNIRNCFMYRLWRSDVFTRDDFTCQDCGRRGGNLNVHHTPKTFSTIIKEYKIKNLQDAFNCEELWNINNGKTLCEKCHKEVKSVKKGR